MFNSFKVSQLEALNEINKQYLWQRLFDSREEIIQPRIKIENENEKSKQESKKAKFIK